MAKPVTTLLSRPSSPESIEDDLAILWRDVARDGPVTRAVMANLVVFRDRPERERVDLAAPVEGVPIDEVALRCPARRRVTLSGRSINRPISRKSSSKNAKTGIERNSPRFR